MLLAARKHNIIHDLTGMLMFSADCFIQTLEGPETTLLRLFERIRRDPRHRDVIVLEEGSTSRRAFADWSMAFSAGEDAIDSLAGLEKNQTFDPEDPLAETRMLRHVETYAAQAAGR